MTDRYVIVAQGAVVSVALWDGESEWPLEDGLTAIRSDTAEVGWTYASGSFTAPETPVAPDPTEDELTALIAARRYLAETSGITVNGMPLDTGRDSQGLVTGAALSAVIDSAYSCQWKTAEGFVDLTAQQIIAIASAMRAHVQACFDREASLLAAVQNGEFVESMLDEGWPQ